MVRYAVALPGRKDTEKVVLENNKLVPATSDEQKQKAFDVLFAESSLFACRLIRGDQDRFIACFNGLCFPLDFFMEILERKIDDSRIDYFCRLLLVDDYVEIPVDENTDILIVDSSCLLFGLSFKYNLLTKYIRYIRLFTLDAESMEFPLPLDKALFDSIQENFDSFVEKIRTLASSNPDFSFLHLVVRVEDQKRDVSDDHKRLPAYIPDDEFHALFGSAPIEHSYYGTQCYISEPIKDFNDIRQLPVAQVIESTFLVVTIAEGPQVVFAVDALCEPFIGKDLILAPFYEFVKAVAEMEWAEVVAKIIHIAQSSGTGKTRLCLELLEAVGVGWYCVYREKSTGFPPCSPWMEWFIDAVGKSTSDEHSVVLCLIFIEQLLAHNPGSNAKKIFLQKPLEVGEIDVSGAIVNNCKAEEKKIHALVTDKNIDVAARLRSLKSKLIKSIEKLAKSHDNHASSIGITTPIFPIVFDECQEMLKVPKEASLITCYRAMRRALMALTNTSIVGIFLGTKSSLNDFVLNWKIDASLRAVVPDNPKLIPPYMLNDTFDAFLNEDYVISPSKIAQVGSIGGTQFFQSEALEQVAIRSGRPLWPCYQNFDAAFDVARYKINSDKKMIDLTCFIMRTGALIVPQNELSHQLVLSGLATLLHVDPSSNNCLTYYFPEPVISNAARIRMTDDERFANGLKEFLMRMNVGTFRNTGVAGEFVSKLLLLKGFDRSLLTKCTDAAPAQFASAGTSTAAQTSASAEASSSQSDDSFEAAQISASASSKEAAVIEFDVNGKRFACPKLGLNSTLAFLVSFTGLGEEELKRLDPTGDVLNGFVAVNQFTQVNMHTVMDEVFLLNGFARATSFALWHQAPGADLIIPVMKRDGAMGCIAVQAKNYDSEFPKSNYLEVNRKLSVQFMSFLKLDEQSVIRISLQFGPKPESEVFGSVEEVTYNFIPYGQRYSVLWLNGLQALDHLLRSPTNDFSSSESLKEGESRLPKRYYVKFSEGHYEQVKDTLYKILCNDRDYYDGIECTAYRDYPMISIRQTSVKGARSLYITAAPCSDNRYSALFDARGQTVYAEKREELLELFNSVGVEEEALEFRKYSFNSRIEGQVEEVTEVEDDEKETGEDMTAKRSGTRAITRSKKPKTN